MGDALLELFPYPVWGGLGSAEFDKESPHLFVVSDYRASSELRRSMWILIPASLCWVVCEERNMRTFEDKSRLPRSIIDAILSKIYDWLFVDSIRKRPAFRDWIFDWDFLIM